MGRIIAFVIILFSISLIVSTVIKSNNGAKEESPTFLEKTEIRISNNRFIPSSVTVPVGGKVIFVNEDSVPHQVASDDYPTNSKYPPLNLEIFKPGEQGDVVFTRKGLFGIHDNLNPTITAQVVVQ